MDSTVVHHESPALGRLGRVERGPGRELEGIITRYCGFNHIGTGAARRREVAQDQVTIILALGPSLCVSGPSARPRELRSFIAPLHPSYAITEEHGALRGIQIDLSPLGAYRLFGVAMHELSAELVIPLEDVLDERTVGELLDRLEQEPRWSRRFELLDTFIAGRVREARSPSPDVIWAWSRLRDTGGAVPIARLADELGCSNRHLVTRFREQVGPSPKTVARLLRFQRAIDRLGHDDGRHFAQIAQTCGYYDQAHLNRDFRELAGTTPGRFVAQLLPDGFGVAA